MILRLALALPANSLNYILYLDNLFFSLLLAKALKKAFIDMTGITRKNTKDTPKWLLTLKEKNKELIWNSALGEIIKGVFIFLWQDNNAVISKFSREYPLTYLIISAWCPPLNKLNVTNGGPP
jgi:hypothetical protein